MSDTEEAVVTAEDFLADAQEPEPAPEPEPVEEPAPAAPDPNELAEKEAWIKKREAELEKGFRKIAERERALPSQPEPKEEGAQSAPLSPEAEAILAEFFEKRYGQKLSFVDTLAQDTIDSELEHFASAKGVEPEVLREVLAESGIQPKEFSRKGLREAFETAHNIHRARTLDLDKLKAEWKEELLSEMKQQGIRVDSVEATGRVDMDEEPGDFMNDDEMDASAKYAAIMKKFKL